LRHWTLPGVASDRWRDHSLFALLPLLGGFALILAAVAVAILLGFQEKRAAADSGRSLAIIGLLNSIETAASDAETGQRGYLLTGRGDYLEPYDAARRQLGPQLDTLATLTSNSPTQQHSIATLRDVVSQKLAELQQTIDLRSKGRGDEANAIVNNDSGERLMTSIREVIASMRDEEARLAYERSVWASWLAALGHAALVSMVILVAVFGTLAVVDARKRILALQAANRSLEQETAERHAAERQVRHLQKIEAIGQLTGGIAHDFNNMLAIIIGSLELARRRLKASDQPGTLRCIDNASDGANRAAQLTGRLLAFSRQQPLEPSVLDANKLVAGMSELLRRTIGETIEVETVLAGGLWRTFADAAQLENALVNLTINARDAMPGGGTLTIETANSELDDRYAAAHSEVTPGQYVMISVTDTGVGMPSEVIERAFDPFYTTKGAGQGTGLGLSQVFGFVKQSSGHVKIYSEVGRGTTVKIYLPRHFGAADAVEEREGAQTALRGAPSTLILVVEDEEAVREMTVSGLRDLGYGTLSAATPRDALQLIEANPNIALLFTDIVLPDMNGRQLAEAAKQRIPGLRVLFTTGYTRNAIVHNGVIDPGVAFLAKPFTLTALAAKVDSALR
jgi:signal transduction histidine kinase